MNNSKEISITLLAELFQKRLIHFSDLEDYDTAHSIWSEFVVDGIDPSEIDFEWSFATSQ